MVDILGLNDSVMAIYFDNAYHNALMYSAIADCAAKGGAAQLVVLPIDPLWSLIAQL